MNYNKLYYFNVVAQTLNFTSAAKQLYISQSAVSRHIKDLEAEFGLPLFIRTNRNLALTDAGKVLYAECRKIFPNEQELYQKVRAAAFSAAPKLSIGFMGIQPAFHLPSITNLLLNKYPQLAITLQRYNWDKILPALNSRTIDVALRLRLGAKTEAGFEHFVLDQTIPSMVVQKKHPLATKKIAQLSDFCHDDFLALSKEDNAIPNTYTENLFKTNHFVPKSYTEYNQVETILMLINSTGGVSLLSRFAAIDQFPDLRIVDLNGIDPLYLELVWRQTQDTNPIILELAETVKNFLEKKS